MYQVYVHLVYQLVFFFRRVSRIERLTWGGEATKFGVLLIFVWMEKRGPYIGILKKTGIYISKSLISALNKDVPISR